MTTREFRSLSPGTIIFVVGRPIVLDAIADPGQLVSRRAVEAVQADSFRILAGLSFAAGDCFLTAGEARREALGRIYRVEGELRALRAAFATTFTDPIEERSDPA